MKDPTCCVFCGQKFRTARSAATHENMVHRKEIKKAQEKLRQQNTSPTLFDVLKEGVDKARNKNVRF